MFCARTIYRSTTTAALLAVIAGGALAEDNDSDSPRITPLVRVIQQIEPGVAALFTPQDGGITAGSGTVIHAQGFVLTNYKNDFRDRFIQFDAASNCRQRGREFSRGR